jgi:hypothetical protein
LSGSIFLRELIAITIALSAWKMIVTGGLYVTVLSAPMMFGRCLKIMWIEAK